MLRHVPNIAEEELNYERDAAEAYASREEIAEAIDWLMTTDKKQFPLLQSIYQLIRIDKARQHALSIKRLPSIPLLTPRQELAVLSCYTRHMINTKEGWCAEASELPTVAARIAFLEAQRARREKLTKF